MIPIHRWSGEYVGFVSNGRLFDAHSNYLGWVEDDGRAWKADGRFLGEIVEGNYLLRRASMIEPIPRIPRIPPIPPISPIPRINRIGRIDRMGWDDAVDW
jgi:hypothetical protein